MADAHPIHPPRELLRTSRLVLRELGPDDAGFLVELLNTPGFLQHIGDRGVRDEAGALDYLRDGPWASYAQYGFGLWHVARRRDGTPLGICGLLQRDYLKAPDIGYALLPAAEGQGYAFEAAQAAVGHAFRILRLPRVYAVIAPDNTRSQRLAERLGMRPCPEQPMVEGGEGLLLYRIDRPPQAGVL